ncbi:CBN-BTB-15 protein [Aphelenchoides avenae]|nr:CBN-BTB-15 protein [Aphelenchus avenae]
MMNTTEPSAQVLPAASECSQEPKVEDAKEIAKASIEHTVEYITRFEKNAGNVATSASVSAGGIEWQLRVETTAADDGSARLDISLRALHESGAWSRWLTADFFVYRERRWRKMGGVSEKIVGSAPLPTSAGCGMRLQGDMQSLVDCWNFTMKFRVDFACWKDSFQEKRDLDDVTFLVQGRPVHANRGYITYVSPVLRAMLTGNFKEGQSDQVPIKQTSAEHFVTFMRAVALIRAPQDNSKVDNDQKSKKYQMATIKFFGSCAEDDNVHVLYGLADVYDVAFLRHDCEKHLMATQGIEAIGKVLLAQSLNKTDFITHLLRSLSRATLKKIQKDKRKEELSAEVKDQLHSWERLFSEAGPSSDSSLRGLP